MTRYAWIREETELDSEDRAWLTGAFTVSFDDGSPDHDVQRWDPALAWARDRADVVYIDAEDEHRHTAYGSDPHGDCPPLPPDIEAALRGGRRRPMVDHWIEREENEDPIEWEVYVEVNADLMGPDTRERAARLGDQLVMALERLDLEDLSWTDESLVRFEREMAARAGGTWTFFGSLGLEVTGRARGATYLPIAQRVAGAVRESLETVNHRMPHDAPDGDDVPAWDARVDVHPLGYQPPFPSHYQGLPTVDVPPDWRR